MSAWKEKIEKNDSVSVNDVVFFYSDAQGDNLLLSPLVWILSDTLYYVRTIDTVTGCMSAIQTINVYEGVYPAESPITGKHIICIDETVTLPNAATEGGIWSISNPSIAEIVSQTSNSVEVKGKIAGNVYVSYYRQRCQLPNKSNLWDESDFANDTRNYNRNRKIIEKRKDAFVET